ncbi:MAG: SET domain-containing protein [Taibaiella sp.]|nr:SET domain-containing protein [Taibaiella sp.]
MTKPQTYLGNTPNKGRGIFTRKRIKAETVIETAPVIIMNNDERLLIDQTILHNYIFEWQPDGQQLCCMALGLIPMYNHAYISNCEYFMDYDNNEIIIQAVRDIEAGEELTINYNATWNDETKIWFHAV